MIRKSPVILKIVQELEAAGHAIGIRHFPKGHLLIEQGTATEILGELEAICKTPALSGVRTICEVSVYALDKGSFPDLLGKHAALNAAILELMAMRLANTATRSARQQLNTLEQNLGQLMMALENEKLPCSKQELAEYLGITLRSLNRLLRKRGAM